MNNSIRHAEQLARAAHAGQTDKAGRDYIAHPARVAQRVGDDPDAQIVAWLHDVVEDTPVTLADLSQQFTPAIVDAVDAITRRPQEPPAQYYQRVAASPLARLVKFADLDDNADPDRLALLDKPTQERLTRKYAAARAALDVPDV